MTATNADRPAGRRGFFTRIAMLAGLIASYGTGAVYGLQFLFPRRTPPRFRRLLVTTMDQLPENAGKAFKDLAGRELILVNTGAGLKAISTTCTHLGCTVYWQPENDRFYCPCHDAVFDLRGAVVTGPPPRPLDTFDVDVDENNSVYVMVRET